ncbi:hypothetical protein LguiB_004581 [Lonicera macranthoides]
MKGISVVRRLVRYKPFGAVLSSQTEAVTMSSCNKPSFFSSMVNPSTTTTSTSIATFMSSQFFNRNLCSSSSGPSNIVVVESEEQLNSTLRKVQDESLPAIFYFTAVWCGPCKLLSPIIGQLSQIYPHVTTYKIDIDQEALGSALNKLDIHSVPTLHLYQDGKKAAEVVGADAQRLRDTMEKLYK